MARQINRPKTPKKVKKVRDGNDPKHLALLRQLPCCRCWSYAPNEVHHLKQTGARGAGMKSPDRFGVPLCRRCHQAVEDIGSKNELEWFDPVDPLALAAALWAAQGHPAMYAVLEAHCQIVPYNPRSESI